MAIVIQRGKKPTWYAQWRNNAGRVIQRRTGIAVNMAGKTPRETKKMAEQLASVMEQTDKGEQTMEAMISCVKAIAVANGLGRPIPTVREYLASVPATSRASSEANRQRAHSVFIEFLGRRADLRLDIVTPAICRDFIHWALERVSKTTAEQYKGYISYALKRAHIEYQYINRNPMELASVGTEMRTMGIEDEGTKRLPFTIDEMRMLINDFPRPWRDMAAVSYYLAGLRLSDVCLLRWDNVDLEKGVVHLREFKTHHQREIALLPVLRERLMTIRAEQNEGEVYVFPKMAEQYQSRYSSRISTDFTALLKAHGILPTESDCTILPGRRHRVNTKSFHSIRHSVVSFARINPNLTPDMVRETVGHRSESVERGYVTAPISAKVRVMEVLADAVKSASSTDAA